MPEKHPRDGLLEFISSASAELPISLYVGQVLKEREVREKEREDFNCENEVKTNGPPPNRKTTRLPALRMPVSGIYLLLESACQWVLDALPLCHGNCGVPIFEPSLQRHLDLTRVIWWY